MTGLDLVNGPEEIRQSRTSDLALRNYRERVGDSTDVLKFDGTSGLPQGVGGPAISQASTEPAEGTTNQDNPESISDGGAVTAAGGEEGRVLDASPGFVENLWVLITVALIVVITLAYSGVRLGFFGGRVPFRSSERSGVRTTQKGRSSPLRVPGPQLAEGRSPQHHRGLPAS